MSIDSDRVAPRTGPELPVEHAGDASIFDGFGTDGVAPRMEPETPPMSLSSVECRFSNIDGEASMSQACRMSMARHRCRISMVSDRVASRTRPELPAVHEGDASIVDAPGSSTSWAREVELSPTLGIRLDHLRWPISIAIPDVRSLPGWFNSKNPKAQEAIPTFRRPWQDLQVVGDRGEKKTPAAPVAQKTRRPNSLRGSMRFHLATSLHDTEASRSGEGGAGTRRETVLPQTC